MNADHLTGSMPCEPQSRAMQFFRAAGLDGIAWSLRRLHCPVAAEALVLEVGSGGNPYPRANVLLDAYAETRERHWAPLVVDRPFVFGVVEHLPFKDKAFDFLIASHVLEHSPAPEKTLTEFQRVAQAGYIEVPDAFLERVNPYHDHRLEITLREGRLQIRKKAGRIVDREVVELYEDRVKPFMTGELIRQRPFVFHVRYYWQENIQWVVLNPDVDATWPADNYAVPQTNLLGFKQRLRESLVRALRRGLSQSGRNKKLDIFNLLQCPTCRSDKLLRKTDQLTCSQCQKVYPIQNGIPLMYPKGGLEQSGLITPGCSQKSQKA